MDQPTRASLPVEIVRSRRRRRTVDATIVDGVIRVRAPASMPRAELDEHVAELVSRLERRYRSDGVDLERRARTLAKRFDLPRPSSISWADQRDRWGSCSIDSRTVRISNRLAAYPPWVLDYVIVHELAHLVVAGHDAAFHAIVARYPLAERARGFLMAVSFGDAGAPAVDAPDLDAEPGADDATGANLRGGDGSEAEPPHTLF